MGYESGATNYLPNTLEINNYEAIKVRSSLNDLTKHKDIKAPNSFSTKIRSEKSGIG